MGIRAAGVTAIAVIVVVALGGCNNDDGSQAGASPKPTKSSGSAPAATPPAKKHTAAELKKALITPPAGAEHSVSDAGRYDKLFGKLQLGMFAKSATRLDKPQCAVVSGVEQKLFGHAPTAYVSYEVGSNTTGESLISANEMIVKRVANEKTPPGCQTVTFKDKDFSMTTKVVSDEPAGIGGGGRIKQVEETFEGRTMRDWSVSFSGPGYLGGVSATGDGVTRDQVVAKAREAYQKATSTLG